MKPLNEAFNPDDETANITALVRSLLTESVFFNDPDCAFKGFIDENATADSRLMMIAGDNSSGKSLVVEYLRTWSKIMHDFATVQISIRERTGAGLSDMAGMRRTCMYGDDSEQGTGATSVEVLVTAFDNLADRIKDGKATLLVLDEPEMGLSPAYAGAMGQYITQRIEAIDSDKAFVVVVSHSQSLAKGLANELGHAPAFLHMKEPQGFAAWCADDSARRVQELLSLGQTDRLGRQSVWSLEGRIKAKFEAEAKAALG